MKNATLPWFQKQSEAFQESVVNLGVKNAKKVLQDNRTLFAMEEKESSRSSKGNSQTGMEVQTATEAV